VDGDAGNAKTETSISLHHVQQHGEGEQSVEERSKEGNGVQRLEHVVQKPIQVALPKDDRQSVDNGVHHPHDGDDRANQGLMKEAGNNERKILASGVLYHALGFQTQNVPSQVTENQTRPKLTTKDRQQDQHR
jgi:hypothetical protein